MFFPYLLPATFQNRLRLLQSFAQCYETQHPAKLSKTAFFPLLFGRYIHDVFCDTLFARQEFFLRNKCWCQFFEYVNIKFSIVKVSTKTMWRKSSANLFSINMYVNIFLNIFRVSVNPAIFEKSLIIEIFITARTKWLLLNDALWATRMHGFWVIFKNCLNEIKALINGKRITSLLKKYNFPSFSSKPVMFDANKIVP